MLRVSVLLLGVSLGCATAPPAPAPLPAQPPPPMAPPPPPAVARVRVIHASPEPLAQTVVVYLDNAPTPVIPALQYRTAVGYADIPVGTHTVQARLPNQPPTSPPALNWQTPVFEEHHTYTIVAHGLALEQPAVTFAPEEDRGLAPAAGTSTVRFFHAVVGIPPVDVCLTSGASVFTNVPYGQWGTGASGGHSTTSPGGAVTLVLRVAGGNACTGRVLGRVDGTLPAGANMSFVAVGRVVPRGVGGQGAPLELLACTDAPLDGPSTCTPVPVAR
ncbi:MAG: DUF4397 domain-containing protein [Deltaproteobacteria bacterium]|nr:DUF4397 domain-containing protein [Deltaproteobacteria bacterium]